MIYVVFITLSVLTAVFYVLPPVSKRILANLILGWLIDTSTWILAFLLGFLVTYELGRSAVVNDFFADNETEQTTNESSFPDEEDVDEIDEDINAYDDDYEAEKPVRAYTMRENQRCQYSVRQKQINGEYPYSEA